VTSTDSRNDRTANTRPHGRQGVARLDAAFDALATEQGRALLAQLADVDDETLVVDDLVARIADDGVADDPLLRAQFHHTHLPKLDDAGLLDYDADRGLVRPDANGRFEELHSVAATYEPDDRPASLDTVFGLLASFRRRTAYRTLLSHGDLSLPDLADEVAVAECEQPLTEIDPDDVLQVYLSLYHTHVPKLASAGLVEYDQDGDFVALTDHGRALESVVEDLCEAVEP
jgi:hypothetical protein